MKTQIKNLMTMDPAAASRNGSIKDVARLMVEFDCGLIPVLDHDAHPVGVITDRDLVVHFLARGENPLELVAADVMREPVVSVHVHAPAQKAVQLMDHHQIRRVIVVDEDGRCEGIVSLADIARRLGHRATAEVIAEVSKPTR